MGNARTENYGDETVTEDNVLDIIESYSIANEFQKELTCTVKDQYGRLYRMAQEECLLIEGSGHTNSKDAFKKRVARGENAWMEKHFKDDPAAKNDKGQWKVRTYLPVAYSSAKSTIWKGLNYNLIPSLGPIEGKSVLAKKIKKHTLTETLGSMSPSVPECIDQASIAVKNLVSALEELNTAMLKAPMTGEAEEKLQEFLTSALRNFTHCEDYLVEWNK